MNMKMKTALYVLACLFSISFGSFASAKIDPETQRRVEFAWEKTRLYMKACLVTDECGLTPAEVQIVLRILANDSKYSAATLKFVEETESQFSSVNGDAHRLMLTGLNPQSPIYINATRIGDVPVETLVGLFAHELLHHLGIVDDASRLPDQFGTRIAALIRRYIVPMNLGLRDTVALIFNYPQPTMGEFSGYFPNGLFPTVFLDQKQKITIQELHMMRQETRNICQDPQEIIWSSQAKITSVAKAPGKTTTYFQFVSRCFKPGQLQEAITYGATGIAFDPSKNDAIGLASISFSKTPVDPVATSTIDVRLTSVPTSVLAGQSIVVKASIEAPKPQDVIGCGALLGNEAWRESTAEVPLTLQTMDCKILSQNGGTKFEVEFRYPVSASAPNGLKLKVQAVSLQLSTKQFIRGIPARASIIEVSNPSGGSKPIPSARVTASGANPMDPSKFPNSFYIARGDIFSFDIVMPSETSTTLADGYVRYQAKMLDGQIMVGVTTLNRRGAKCVQSGAELRCGTPIDLMTLANEKEVVMWAPVQIVLLTDDLQFISRDVSADELGVVSTIKKP